MATIVNDRIDIRISKEQKKLFKYASELRGFKSLSEFVIFCIKSESNRIFKDNETILKTSEDKKIFVDALLNPPMPNDKLKKAQITYNTFIENGFNN